MFSNGVMGVSLDLFPVIKIGNEKPSIKNLHFMGNRQQIFSICETPYEIYGKHLQDHEEKESDNIGGFFHELFRVDTIPI